jgi:hypothetical protein
VGVLRVRYQEAVGSVKVEAEVYDLGWSVYPIEVIEIGVEVRKFGETLYKTTSMPSGARVLAARRRAVFEEAFLRLPEMARSRTNRGSSLVLSPARTSESVASSS